MTTKKQIQAYARIQCDTGAVKITPQGYLKAPAHVTRTGVFLYRLKDGTIQRQLRLPDEVFKRESMDTLRGIPITREHPDVRLLNADNTKNYMVGFTGDRVEVIDSNIETDITITDQRTIEDVQDGVEELSCGYTWELDPEDKPGIYQGEPYDVVQRNIEYNHVAVVRQGRAGPNIRLLLDSADAVDSGLYDSLSEAKNMEKILIGGKEYEVSAELKGAIQASFDSKDAELNKVKVSLDTVEAERDDVKGKLDKAQASLDSKDGDKEFLERFNARNKILQVANDVLDDDTKAKLDGMTENEIKIEIVKAERPNVSLDGKGPAYIEASFDMIAEGFTGKDSGKEVGDDLTKGRQASADSGDIVEAAKKRARERAQNAWKPKEQRA